MTKYFVGLLFLAACSQSNPVSTDKTSNPLPPGAILIDYQNVDDLKKAVIKSGDVILQEGDVKNNQRHGVWTSYYPTGKIQTITSYLEGKKQGPEIQFDNSGYITSRAPFVNDVLAGEYRSYSRGLVIERKNYANGQLNGLVQKYYPNGTIMEESTYVDGVIDGEARWYNQEGQVKIRYTYDMGELVDDGSESD